jgi:hypothetical protein
VFLHRVLLLAQITGGQLVRDTEIISLWYCNTVHRLRSNLDLKEFRALVGLVDQEKEPELHMVHKHSSN